ncbi:4-alpha-glucanotransferase [Corynebacterium ammoniagenes]|uniref:4-alpha-glucanotransferase n=1 Tax=Corynebacterium ammoniagenes TaxID=1697 RepID=A0AAV5G4P5_CORAM|nr:4-alpha-glucanotransferase [Corynebacterium ammoniagenes]GJN41961.1 4-alpha-glucanotransferase [Corynebacterium ammoniagenes]
MTYRQLLEELASNHGISTGYFSQGGPWIDVSDATLEYTLRALDVDLSPEPDESELTTRLYLDYLARASRPLPPAVVAPAGTEKSFDVHVHDGSSAKVHIVLEHGGQREVFQDPNDTAPVEVDGTLWGEATFHIPGDLPLGFHQLQLRSDGFERIYSCPLIITPQRLTTADKYVDSPVSGMMAQLYSVRSEKSWGMGDFGDLGDLAEIAAKKAGADFLLINPLHAAQPEPPVEDSPYLPTTRRFINPIYLRIEDIPELELLDAPLRADVAEIAEEFRERNHSAEPIERNPIFEAKLAVLRELFALEHAPERTEQFHEFTRAEGEGLVYFAQWCARNEAVSGRHAMDDEEDHEHSIAFYSWLQFLCDEQLRTAQLRARKAGMKIGIITDLAVGVHPGGADAEILSEYLAPQASVGAPPDDYNQQGQDWSQPPWHPVRLAESGYKPWREMLATVLRNAGGVRVDHILGLFRLYWIPRMSPPTSGTYVAYDFEAMLGILALEAERAGAVVIGEDLGTMEPWIQDTLREKGFLGTSIVWFERDHDGSPLPQDKYRPLALSSVGTHDLPPTLAYLGGEHITLRDRLGLFTRPVEDEVAEDMAFQAQVLHRMSDTGLLPERDFAHLSRKERGNPTQLMGALHAFIAGTPSALTCTNLVDMVGDIRAQNQPGTTSDLYPNWCIPLCDSEGHPVLIEQLANNALFQAITATSKRTV